MIRHIWDTLGVTMFTLGIIYGAHHFLDGVSTMADIMCGALIGFGASIIVGVVSGRNA